jgi:hypothetical protein
MSETSKDELIAAQNQVIGILFEIIKRLQANNDLDEEYFQIIENKKRPINKKRLDEIMEQRTENSKIVTTFLKKLEV